MAAKLAELRETVGLIAAAKDGGAEKLAPAKRDAVLSQIVTRPVAVRGGAAWRWLGPASLAAAALLAVAVHLGTFGPTRHERELERELASLKSRVPTFQDGIPLDNRPTATVPVNINAVSDPKLLALTVVGENGLFVRDQLRAPGDAFDLRVRSVYPLNRLEKLRKLRQGEVAGKRVAREGDLLAGGYYGAFGPDEESSNTEEYNPLVDNPFLRPFDAPLSTFSIDVDTAAYANVRRFLNDGQLPPPDAVRLEELVNYFHYAYTPPAGAEPFSVALEAHAAPWEPKHQLVRIGLQGREIDVREAPAANLVFLVDVSGSMSDENKLPLVQKSLHMLTEGLRPQDKVAMVVYAGAAGAVLPPTSGERKDEIKAAIDRLSAGGSTNGGAGIELAYKLAAEHFVKDGVNRVVLCTDGDFNVGTTSEGDLDRLIEEKRKTGVFLSVLGFGTGNYADARMQGLAQKGNGNAAYIDSLREAKKVLVEQATGTLITIAKDVKIQVEFNPSKVAAYRLIGYETRLLAAQDFNDDKKDAGEIGAGHQVTALYAVIPAGQDVPAASVDELKYQKPAAATAQGDAAAEICTVKLRYKAPDGNVSKKIEFALADPGLTAAGASTDFEFAASVAAFAMCLRDSEYKGQANFGLVKELAMAGLGDDAKGYRKEFVEIVKKATDLAEAKKKAQEEKK
ncbi:MAG: VWA domain-containing protein [Planctomycetia bacterium]|nr:VWA domain-containing protein [Planctomycetia bacterium]